MPLQLKTDLKEGQVNCLCWINSRNQENPRNDMVITILDFNNQQDWQLRGTRFQDVGLPVLQPSNFSLNSLFEAGNQLSSHSEAEALAQLVAVVCLSQTVNRPLTSGKSTSTVSDSVLDHFGLGGFDAQEAGITVPQELTDFGQEAGLLAASETTGDLHPSSLLVFEHEKSFSALDACEHMKRYRNRFGIEFSPSLEHIDLQVAGQALNLFACPTAQAVCYYGDSYNPHQKYRLQAAETYPMLAEFFAGIREASDAVDRGEPLVPLLQRLRHLTQGKLKRIAKFREFKDSLDDTDVDDAINQGFGINRPRRFNLDHGIDLNTIIAVLPSVETNLLPNSNDEWQYFIKTVSACAVPVERELNVSIEVLTKSSKGKWKEFYSQLATSAQIPAEGFHYDHLTSATEDALEALDDFARTIFLPRILYSMRESYEDIPEPDSSVVRDAVKASLVMLSGNSTSILAFLINLGQRWVNRSQSLSEIKGINRGAQTENALTLKYGDNWPRLAEDYQATNKLTIRNLNTKAQFEEESRRLSHCVGRDYVETARRGLSHIFSVQSPDGKKSLSTFEIGPPDRISPHKGMRLRQHKGKRNTKPGPQCIQALNEWFSRLRAGKIALKTEEVVKWRQLKREKERYDLQRSGGPVDPATAWKFQLGTLWENQNIHNRLWDEWSQHILSGSLAELESTAFICKHRVGREFLTRFQEPDGILKPDRQL